MFELSIEDLLREINIKNFYRGEYPKRKDPDITLVQTATEQQDALMYHMRSAVTDILMLANHKSMKFTCDYDRKGDKLIFTLSPMREGVEHLEGILRESVRQYIVYEVQRRWMMAVVPDMADHTLRNELLNNVSKNIGTVGVGARVRRRATDLAGI